MNKMTNRKITHFFNFFISIVFLMLDLIDFILYK